MLKRVKLVIFLIILNIVITNNNIKVNYNNNLMKKRNTTSTTSTISTISTISRNPKQNKDNIILVKNGTSNIASNSSEAIEVAREWVINKEEEIVKETSIFVNITEILKKKLANVSIKPNTIHLVIKYVMELVEETPIKGVEQKEFALKVMRELFKDLTEGEDELVLLKLLDDGSISNIIDLVVDATNGKLNVNTVIETSVGCINTCLPYLTRNRKNHKTIVNKKN